VSLPEGVTVSSVTSAQTGATVLRVNNANDGITWAPLFALPASRFGEGEIEYAMSFDTEAPANHVQPGLAIRHKTGEVVYTATRKNFSTLTLAEPPYFRSQGKYSYAREDRPKQAVFGLMLHGPGTVEIETAGVLIHSEPFRGIDAATALMMMALAGFGFLFCVGVVRAAPGGFGPMPFSLHGAIRTGGAVLFLAGFFVLPQFESNWTIPCILAGAITFLLADLPVLRQFDEDVNQA
jgi:hypothetical protein